MSGTIEAQFTQHRSERNPHPNLDARISALEAAGGGGGGGGDVSTHNVDPAAHPPRSFALTYNPDGTLASKIDAGGIKSFSYSDGRLIGVVGTGAYSSKEINYDGDGRCIGVTVL